MLFFRVCFIFLVAVILHSGAEASEISPPSKPNNGGSASSGSDEETRKELLLFFQEEDLVAATKRPMPLRNAPAVATVITSEEIRDMGARNIMDVLKMLPSIGISIDEFGRFMFEVRGIRTITSEKVLLMIDGHRLNETFTGSAIANVYNDLPVENIKRIEVIRGPGSALYGANAFVAVINIVTKDADDTNGVKLTAAGGSFDTRNPNITGGKTFGGFQVSGSIDYLNTDGPSLPVEKDRLSKTPFSEAPGRTRMNEEKSDIFLKMQYEDLSLRGQFTNKQRGAFIGFSHALTNDNSLDYQNFWYELRYARNISDDLFLSVKAYHDQFTLDSRFEIFPDGFPGFPEGMEAKTHLIDRTLGSEIQVGYRLSQSHYVTAGAQYENIRQYDVKFFANFNPLTNQPLGSFQEVSPAVNFNKDARRDVYALYAQDEWKLRNNLNLTAGIRYDHYSDFGDTFNPRLGLVWSFDENGELKLLYGRAFRAPNFKELYDQNNSFSLGNPDLRPETINTFEAGVGYKFAKNIKMNATYFFSRIHDLIDRDTSITPTKYMNEGNARVNGIELELAGKYAQSAYWKLGYIYQNPEDADTGKRLPNVPSHRATGSINYEFSRYLNSHVDVLWTGPRPRSAGDTRPDVPSYTTVDLTLIAKNFCKNLEIKGAVHNLFDNRYKDPDTSGALQFVPNDFPREGISAIVSVSYKF